MKQASKNDAEMLDLINKIQTQLIALDKKVDTLINRSLSTPKPSSPTPPVNNDRNKGRTMYDAICADCKKECSIPFKPSGDRPVYCKDCFSRRKVISLSKITVTEKPKEVMSIASKPEAKKKKAAPAKKTVAKKKTAPKKK